MRVLFNIFNKIPTNDELIATQGRIYITMFDRQQEIFSIKKQYRIMAGKQVGR